MPLFWMRRVAGKDVRATIFSSNELTKCCHAQSTTGRVFSICVQLSPECQWINRWPQAPRKYSRMTQNNNKTQLNCDQRGRCRGRFACIVSVMRGKNRNLDCARSRFTPKLWLCGLLQEMWAEKKNSYSTKMSSRYGCCPAFRLHWLQLHENPLLTTTGCLF